MFASFGFYFSLITRVSQASSPETMKLASWNVGGFRRLAKSNKFKTWANRFDVLLLQESMLLSNARPISLPGFSQFRSDAVRGERGRPSGGLMSCISHDVLRVFEVEEVATNFSEAEALLLKLTRRSLRNDVPNVIFMLNLYLPSPPKKFSFANFKHELDHGR
jgi:exonuclease III